MHLEDAIDDQPEHSAVLYEPGAITLQRSVLVEEHDLQQAFERVPWERLVFLRCDRHKGGKRNLSYRWRAHPEGWRGERTASAGVAPDERP
jgi:hypothetical protein